MTFNWAAYEEELEKLATGVTLPGSVGGVIDPKATVSKPPSPSVKNPTRAGAQGMGWMRGLPGLKRIPRI